MNSGNKMSLFEQGQIELLFLTGDHEFPLHSHESMCIGIVREGNVDFCIGNKEATLTKGGVYVIPPNVGVTIKPIERYKYLSICIKGDLKKEFEKYHIANFYLELDDLDDFLLPCYEFMWSGEEKKFVEDLISILEPIMKKRVDGGETKLSPYIKKIADYLKNNTNEKFDLDNIAQMASTSKYYLVRQFKRELGVTPHQYYIQNKMRIAKKDILNDQEEIQIATELNFADQSHLCRNFKQQMGITIQEYKRNFKKK